MKSFHIVSEQTKKICLHTGEPLKRQSIDYTSLSRLSSDHLVSMVQDLMVQNEELLTQISDSNKKNSYTPVEIPVDDCGMKYRTLFENNPIETIIVDNHGKVTGYNQAKERSNGRLPYIGDLMYRDYAGKHEINMHMELMECIRSNVTKEFPEQKYDGRYLHIRISPFPGGAIITSIDRTGSKLAEEALRASEKQYRTVVSNIPGAVYRCVYDTNWIINFISDMVEDITGFSVSNFIMKKLMDHINIIYPDDRHFVKKTVRQAIEKKMPYIVEFRIIHADGQIRWVYNKGQVINGEEGKSPCLDGIIFDITEKKMMEDNLLRVQKLESLGVLAGGIAHDFNNLLTAILGNISLAKIFAETDEKVLKILTEAEKASLRAGELTKRFITFSKGGTLVKKAASVEGLIRDSANLALSGSNIRCDFLFSKDLWQVEVDEGQINQVVNNITTNAREAMPEGGIINIEAENIIIKREKIEPDESLRDGSYVKISIRDHGCGIPSEYISKIFDPYFSTKEMGTQKGMGMGLTTAYSIIKNHDGYIEVKSEEGTGTVFCFYLSAFGEDIPEEIKPEKRLFDGKGRNILVMDDEEVIRNVAGEMLEQIGYKVEFVQDGKEAVELYKKKKDNKEPFDAVILDLTVPGGMGGKVAIQKLLEIDPDVKGVASSGYSDDSVMIHFKKSGFSGAMAKPYNIFDLGETLHEVITGNSKNF